MISSCSSSNPISGSSLERMASPTRSPSTRNNWPIHPCPPPISSRLVALPVCSATKSKKPSPTWKRPFNSRKTMPKPWLHLWLQVALVLSRRMKQRNNGVV
ncbi:hypothetical protein CC1G_00843 [Coprinopsis cinerea okayama7|uniref:Uncharacterized protein n=1 Tax=Coprinopsis cinerea (strain Okayama-7 / 130 / ATCC MYA-4618 / FGSC 9003) TaxID=240176 RepID=A8N8W8_COPC7|nr:hypothetical protein CC1G_00843 [Coprinopsis cinerea okayama7\|eukprot:XP_001831296.2 hypothetical protein CC1G_00843 [Coprinopsis cinerea okayama7\